MSAAVANSQHAQFGVIGLGVMGENLSLNIEEHGFRVAVWNLETEWVDRFVNKNSGKKFVGTKSLQELVRAMARPRAILMMIKAGDPVDMTLEKLTPLLESGDIVIDGGNSWFKDTQRREAALRAKGQNFVGMGVSGGGEGARHGPSLMPGGSAEAYSHMKPILESIAAKTDSGPCVTHVGPDGAGHFVKMVHNGIEYGDMQLIAEAYDILRKVLGLDAKEIGAIFAEWNRGPLESFLIEITSQIFSASDPKSGKPLVDMILDKAGQKGTGKWTAQVALDLGMPVPTMAAALDGRVLSSMKDQRISASKKLSASTGKFAGAKKDLIAALHDALYAAKICSYTQGMSLIQEASKESKWGINLKEMARIWKGGCIIRARFLDDIMKAFERQPDLPNLLLDPTLMARIQSLDAGWRSLVQTAITCGVPVPAMSASLGYFDSYRSASLPQNLTQAQRDFFGAHTYQRVDDPNGPFVHSDWQKLIRKDP